MNTVEPIRDVGDIEKMKSYLLASNYRDYLLFVLGINTGLRISDLLKLKVSDIRGKFHIVVTEKKTRLIGDSWMIKRIYRQKLT